MIVLKTKLLNVILLCVIIEHVFSVRLQREVFFTKSFMVVKNANETNESNQTIEKNDQNLKNFDPLEFLSKFGYLRGHKPINQAVDDLAPRTMVLEHNKAIELEKEAEKIRESIKKYQNLHELNATGEIDEATLNLMKSPRCGVPDFDSEDNHTRHKRSFDDLESPMVWNKTNLTYKILNSSADLSFDIVRKSIARAFQDWSEATHLSFTEVTDVHQSADILLSFEQWDHLDGTPFDGVGQTLAHAFYPQDGRVHFDSDEHYTHNSTQGINLRMIATHEIGHAIGLKHIFDKKSIMYDGYLGYVENFSLPDVDREFVKKFFNLSQNHTNPKNNTDVAAPNRLKLKTEVFVLYKNKLNHSTKNNSSNSPCWRNFQVTFTNHRNRVYVVTDDTTLWQYDKVAKLWTTYPLNEIYPELHAGAKGVLLSTTNLTWYFKSRTVWAYKNFFLLPGYPTNFNFTRIAAHSITGIVEKNGHIYLLKNDDAYFFDTDSLTLFNNDPFSFTEMFPGVPKSFDSAMIYNGVYYFFKGIWVYRFDQASNRVMQGDPKLKSEVFEPCIRRRKNKTT